MQTHNTTTGPISCQLARRAASGVPRSRGPAAVEARDSSHTRLGTLVFPCDTVPGAKLKIHNEAGAGATLRRSLMT